MNCFFYHSACVNRWFSTALPGVRSNKIGIGTFALALISGVAAVSSAAAQVAPCLASNEATAAANIAASINSTISTLDTAFLAPGSAFVNSPASKQADFTAAGTWVRGIGGKVETTSTATSPATSPGTSQTTCSNKIRLEYGGVQVGQDFAKLNLGGSDVNLHFGASAGYAEGKLKDLGVSFGGGNVQAAFVGPYSVLTYGNFVADLSARFNLYRFDISVRPESS